MIIAIFVIPVSNSNLDKQKNNPKNIVSQERVAVAKFPEKEKVTQEINVIKSKAKILGLASIVRAINASNQDNLGYIYEGLLSVLDKSNSSDNLKNIVSRWKESLVAQIIGDEVVISTVDQYKIDGFVLFFDYETETLLFSSYDFGLGIKAIKVFHTKEKSPEYLVSVKYMTQSGTGMYGESVRIYAIENNTISTALDKPYMEYLGGSWGAYKSDVSFEQNNKLVMDKSYPKITTIGLVSYTNSKGGEVQVELPNEEYIWDKNSLVFMQVAGRQTNNIKTMSGMYADYAEPNGDWFEAPRDSNDISFESEQW